MLEDDVQIGDDDEDVQHGEEGASGISDEDLHVESQITPEMLFKISKKVAQLTKVIYSLNTK